MVVIKGGPIDSLLGFVITDIPTSTINQVIADFKIGAFHEYDPMVELSLEQTRFIGVSPEQVRDQLNAEDVREPFVLLDTETTVSRSVWWVGRYLDEEEEDGAAVTDQWRQGFMENVSSDERMLLKARIATIEVPMFYVNDKIDNMGIFDILDGLPLPFDPHGPQEPWTAGFDWEHDPPSPPPAYIDAMPDEYEKSSSAEHTQSFERPTEVVRLKEDVAEENGLRSEWTPVVKALGSEDGFPEGSLTFSQPWARKELEKLDRGKALQNPNQHR